MGCAASSEDGASVENGNQPVTRATQVKQATSGPGSVDWNESAWKSDTREIWQRVLSILPVHMDIPRLGRKMVILDANGNAASKEYTDDDNVTKAEIILDLFKCLSQQLGEGDRFYSVFAEKYYQHLNKAGEGDISQQLHAFIVSEVPNDSKLGLVLKGCHQKIVFPGFYSIKNKIYNDLPFKDKRGSWVVIVQVTPEKLFIRHRKEQAGFSGNLDLSTEEFSFQWQLEMVFDSQLKEMTDVDVSIVNLNISNAASAERAASIRGVFKRTYGECGANSRHVTGETAAGTGEIIAEKSVEN